MFAGFSRVVSEKSTARLLFVFEIKGEDIPRRFSGAVPQTAACLKRNMGEEGVFSALLDLNVEFIPVVIFCVLCRLEKTTRSHRRFFSAVFWYINAFEKMG